MSTEAVHKTCWYCHKTPYDQTTNIGTQRFNDKTVSNVKLNPFDTGLLTVDTWNVPGREGNRYTITTRINFCPMCGRRLEKEPLPFDEDYDPADDLADTMMHNTETDSAERDNLQRMEARAYREAAESFATARKMMHKGD